jgi:uncharacterized protein YndB with AHSA1/START domain
MRHVSASIGIRRPPAEVFAMLLDVDRLPDWATTVIATRDLSHQSLQIGCTFRQTVRLVGRQLESEWRVTEFEPPRRIAYAATSSEGGRLEMRQLVVPMDAGSEVTFEIDYVLPGGFLGRLVDRTVAAGRAELEAERSLQNLRRLLEGGSDEAEAMDRDG